MVVVVVNISGTVVIESITGAVVIVKLSGTVVIENILGAIVIVNIARLVVIAKLSGTIVIENIAGAIIIRKVCRIIGTPEVTQLVANISAIYSPELTVGFTVVCCSDHQSFHEQGYPATHLFERAGPSEINPHQSIVRVNYDYGAFSCRSYVPQQCDRPGYDLNQVRSICKVQFATLLHAAGFDLPEGVNLEELD
ncbi:hypothetical protein EDC04DRAFT_2992499 [Pisolithus marmoratus]|nr:hypothetical protein EDC04DRAFT_2992499 [Pisolithus marmoratus]